MPLTVPVLDTRTWSDLVAEARARLPREAPGWTDHNVHDPGITLIELFAWLTEQQLFRLDRVPPPMQRAFLRLLGVRPEPPTSAETVVVARLAPGGAVPVQLSAGSQFADPFAAVVFESSASMTVTDAWLDDLAGGPTGGRVVVESGARLADRTADNADPARTFAPLGRDPRPGDALRLGFDRPPAGPGDTLSLFLWNVDGYGDADGPPDHYRARTVWEYGAADGSWRTFATVDDRTRALSVSGQVLLGGIPDHPVGPDTSGYWIRCRLAAGGYECPPVLAAVAVNAVPVRHAAALPAMQSLGTSRGQAGQAYALGRPPVVAGSTRLRLSEPAGDVDEAWQEVADWDRTGPHDRHYRLGPDSGEIRFGDGRTGVVPGAGVQITALTYRTGGGPSGNVPAGTVTRLLGGDADRLVVRQPRAAEGGAAAEPLGRARGRALRELARPARAVTADDVVDLALRTPGVPVARAFALPGHHPAYPHLPASGVVTVVVLPRCGNPPAPSAEFLDAVRCWLERHRTVTTELHVVGPVYVPLTVTATLHAPGTAASAELPGRAQAALDMFFDPLTGGPAGSGWPVGRDVLRSETLAVLAGLPGVRYVDGLGLSTPTDSEPRCGNLPLCPGQLVDSQVHRITVAEVHR